MDTLMNRNIKLIAASLMLRNSLSNSLDMVGGMDAWGASALPLTVLTAPACEAGKQNEKDQPHSLAECLHN